MKKHSFIFFFFFFFLISCETVKQQQDLQADDLDDLGEEEAASEVIGATSEDEEFADEDDLESEFADSEEFEKEMKDQAFSDTAEEEATAPPVQKPSDSQAQKEEKQEETEDIASSAKEDADAPDDDDDVEDLFLEDATEEDQLAEGEEEEQKEKQEQDIADTDAIGEEQEQDIADTDATGEEQEQDIADTDATGDGGIINNIRYEAGENKIYIDGTGSFSYQSRENKDNNQFIVEIPGAILSESLRERPFVMKDFSTEMALLQADQKDSNTVRIVIQLRGTAGKPSVSISDTGSLVIAASGSGSVEDGADPKVTTGDQTAYSDSSGRVLPAKSLEEFFLHTPEFTGRPISIHFEDVDVQEVLYFISEGTGLNMVLSDDVSGTISIKLRNVPWDQALVTVMKTKKLGYIREGNVIRIMSLSALKQDQKEIKEMMEGQKELDPLKVKVIPLVYTKPADIEKTVRDFLTKDRGKIVTDDNSNSLIVTDVSRAIERIEAMIKNLDKPPIQVMIEAKIVEARETFVRNFGIRWGFDGVPFVGPWNDAAPPLALTVTGDLQAFPGQNITGRTVASGLNVAFAPLGNLDLSLGLSEAEDLIRVLSAPRIMVLNGKNAKITQKTESIDVVTTQTDTSTQASPQRVSANLEFDVTPQITALGSVFMDIKMTRDFFGPPEQVTGSRPVNSRQANTQVLVNNGQTIVIGGIYQHDETQSDEGLPLLRHIPLFKWLFSRFTSSEERNELLLFLTPRILDIEKPASSPAEVR